MSDLRFIILSGSYPEICLKSIEEEDLEDLRRWKNFHKDSFFYQQEITRDQQKKWFNDFLLRKDDYMFVVKENIHNKYVPIGSMGFRILENNNIDIYNVMRGDNPHGSKAKIGDALRIMGSYISKNFKGKITAKVLACNPARTWYENYGFKTVKNYQDYLDVEIDYNNFKFSEVFMKREGL